VTVHVYDSSQTLVAERRNFLGGTFSITGLAPGTYFVQVVDQWYSNRASFAEADPITVSAGADTGGINITLGANDLGWIQGRVYDAATNEPVCATIAEQIRPRSDGTYTLGLEPGSWTISFVDNCEFAYASQWWDGQPDQASADVIAVTAGATINGIDAAMSPPGDAGGWISGTVIEEGSGNPVFGICAIPFDENGEQVPQPVNTPSPRSGTDGFYRIGHLGEGTFRVQFADCSHFVYQTVWWRDAETFEGAEPIIVTLGEEVAGINVIVELRPGASPPGSGSGSGGTVGELPFTGPDLALGVLGSAALVLLGTGMILVAWSRPQPSSAITRPISVTALR
jgi:hypothetical protein